MAVSSLSPIITVLLSGIVAVASSYFTNYFLKKDRLGIEIKSKHRQDWINSLRTDIAYICSKANFIANNLNAINMEENGKDQTTNNIKRIFAYNQLEEKSFEVLLFLNPDEKLHQKLEKKLEELNKVLIDYINTSRNLDIFELNSTLPADRLAVQRSSKKDVNSLIKDISDTSRTIFKSEWERIKKGE